MPPRARKVDAPAPPPQLAKEAREGRPLGRTPKTARTKASGRGDGATDVKIPTDGSRANIKSDQEWVDAQRGAGALKIIEDDTDVPFGVKEQWSGKAEDWGSAMQVPDHPNRCTGRAFVRDEEGRRIIDSEGKILTRPCAKWKMRGSNVCSHHGGLTDGGKAIAQRRLTEAADMATGRLIRMIDDPATDPAERLRAINSLLDRAGIKGGVEITLETPEWQQMLKDMWETAPDEAHGTSRERAADAGAPPRKKATRPVAKPRSSAKEDS